MGDIISRYSGAEPTPDIYVKIDEQLASAADKLCMMEQLSDFSAEMGDVRKIFQNIESFAHGIDNDRLSALSRAVHLMINQIIRTERIQADTYAYLIYSTKVIRRLASLSRYSEQTGFEVSDTSFGEAISAIIDHTDELIQPHMRN
jgi:hypothetical protein